MSSSKQWITLVKCCFCTACSIGVVSNCIGIFYSPLSEALGVGVAKISAVVMMMSIATAISSLVFAKLSKIIPLKTLMLAGIGVDILGFFVMSLARSLAMLYTGALMLGFGAAFYGPLPVTRILRETYGEKNGTPLGITVAVSGVVGAILNPILSKIILSSGYTNGLRLLSLIIACTALPAALTLSISARQDETQAKKSATPTSAKPSLGVLALLFLMAACFFTQNGMNTHISNLAVSTGYTLSFSATCVSAIMISNTVFKLLFGVLADKKGPVLATRVFLCIGLCGTLSMLLGRTIPFFMILGPALFGANFSCSMIGANLMCQKIAKEHYTDVFAKLTVMTTLCYAMGTTIYGSIKDITGSYQPALLMVSCLAVCGFLMTGIVGKRITD